MTVPTLSFTDTAMCRGKVDFPFKNVSSLTMIAVGVGIAPMIQTLRSIFKCIDRNRAASSSSGGVSGGSEGDDNGETFVGNTPTAVAECSVKRVVLLYGVVSNS